MWSIITAAGWPIWPLIFASVVALAIVIERIWALRPSILVPANLAQEVTKTLPQFAEKQNISRLASHSALGSILAEGLTAHMNGSDVALAMQEKAEVVSKALEKHLDVLALIASAAPLMGLLGTVVGMIDIFAAQGQAVQSPEAIAAGIAVALYNTAFGLIVAIPALVAYRLLKMRIGQILDKIEQEVQPLEQLLLVAKQKSAKPARS
ncbi:MAG: MotA/TolQ/ExbB proton channel family protein [Limnobacter sp.]|nr:MotA/TolQ/ExbB proton channel family protein [Limnobacter sp.]